MFGKRNPRRNNTLIEGDLLNITQQDSPVSRDLSDNRERIHSILGDSPDIAIRTFEIKCGNGNAVHALLLCIEGLVDDTSISEEILKPLLREAIDHSKDDFFRVASKIYRKEVRLETDLIQAIQETLNGSALILIEGSREGFIIPVDGYKGRAIDEPPFEVSVRGPREGFVESLGTNLAMVRYRLRHPALRIEQMTIGEITRNKVAVLYVQGIVKPELVERLKDKLQQIDVDDVFDSGAIEQYIEDTSYTLLPTIGNTERPDKAARMLMEGRIVVILDGTPVVLFVPYLFVDAFQSMEDYSSRPYYSSFIRILRVLSFFLSTLLPSVFVASLNFHKSMIPSELITSMEAAREKVPFPLVIEVVFMMVMFELVREAGVRMPRPLGQAVSIVGALILGEVSVDAGLIGAPTIIVTSTAGIASFLINPLADVTAILRIGLLIPSSILGFYGLLVTLLMLMTHMVSLTSLSQ